MKKVYIFDFEGVLAEPIHPKYGEVSKRFYSNLLRATKYLLPFFVLRSFEVLAKPIKRRSQRKFNYLEKAMERSIIGLSKRDVEKVSRRLKVKGSSILRKLLERGEEVYVLTAAPKEVTERTLDFPQSRILGSEIMYQGGRIVGYRPLDKRKALEELRKKYPDHVFILITDGQNDATIADMFDEVKVVPPNYVPGWKLLRSFVGTPKFPHEKIKGLSELLKGWTLPLGKFEEILKGIGFERASEELEREVREVLSEKSLEEILKGKDVQYFGDLYPLALELAIRLRGKDACERAFEALKDVLERCYYVRMRGKSYIVFPDKVLEGDRTAKEIAESLKRLL